MHEWKRGRLLPRFAIHLAAWCAKVVSLRDQFRILDVNRAIAELAADFRSDHNTPFEDSLLAATAKVHNLTLATRNTADFEGCDIDILNPWEFDT